MPDVEALIARHAPWAAQDRDWPLTPFEQFMWLDDRPEYPLVFEVVLRFAGRIDAESMAGAWRFALARHPLLRATVVVGPRGPVWRARAGGGSDLHRVARHDVVSSEPVAIDLQRAAGLRGTLEETAEGSDLRLVFHHACCDGHGARMFLQDLVLAYAVLRGAGDDDAPFFRSDATLLDDRATHPPVPEGRSTWWRRLWNSLRFVVVRPTPVAGDVPPSARAAARGRAAPVPGHRTHTFSAAEVSGMDVIQGRFSATRNDIAIAMLFEVLADWQRRRGAAPRSRLRVAVPTDLRGRADERMPAANRYTYIFLERQVAACGGWQSLLAGLQRDFQERRQEGRGAQFLAVLRKAAPFRRATRWFLHRDGCFSTAVLTNLSDPSWRLRKKLPVDAEGMMWLDAARCLDIQIRTPPLRPGTGWGFGIFEYAGRMTISFRYDATLVSASAADAIVARFVELWRALLATAAVTPDPVAAPTVASRDPV